MIETQEVSLRQRDSATDHLLRHGQKTLRYTSYREEFKRITCDLPSAILLTQIVYYASTKGWGAFYKFNQPCEHPLYQEGDSWTEELGWSYYRLSKARSKIATKNTTDGDPKAILGGRSMDALVMFWTDRNNETRYYLNKKLLDECLERLYDGRPMPWNDPAGAESCPGQPEAGQDHPESPLGENGRETAPEPSSEEARPATIHDVDNPLFYPPFLPSIEFGNLNPIGECEIQILCNTSPVPHFLLQDLDYGPVDCGKPSGSTGQNKGLSNNGSSSIDLLRRRARKEDLCDKDAPVPIQRKLLRSTQESYEEHLDLLVQKSRHLNSLTLALAHVVGPRASRKDARQILTSLTKTYPIRWVIRAFVIAAYHYDARDPLAYMGKTLSSWDEATPNPGRSPSEQQPATSASQDAETQFEKMWRQMDPNLKRSIRNYVLERLPESVTRRIRVAGAKPTLSGYDRWPYSAQREFHARLVQFIGEGRTPKTD